jgi:hypothetical protein
MLFLLAVLPCLFRVDFSKLIKLLRYTLQLRITCATCHNVQSKQTLTKKPLEFSTPDSVYHVWLFQSFARLEKTIMIFFACVGVCLARAFIVTVCCTKF